MGSVRNAVDSHTRCHVRTNISPLEKQVVRSFFPETSFPIRFRMYSQTRDVKSHLTNETFGQTVHYRLHVRSNPLTDKYTPLGSIPFARLSRIDRIRKIARKTDFAVLYFDVEIVKRGYYKTTIREIALRPNELPEFEITDRYTAIMEKTILRNPWAWLWTHKRWKYKHEDFPGT